MDKNEARDVYRRIRLAALRCDRRLKTAKDFDLCIKAVLVVRGVRDPKPEDWLWAAQEWIDERGGI